MVTSTPHLGASTVDAQTRVAVEIAQQFVAFTRQTALTGAVSITVSALLRNKLVILICRRLLVLLHVLLAYLSVCPVYARSH